MVISQLRIKLRAQLKENPNEADWIISHVTGLTQSDFILKNRTLTENETEQIEKIVSRRNSGEPLQYILGETEFMGLKFKVNPSTLIPRQDTELLVQTAIDLTGNNKTTVLDIGTGSGCVGISIAKLCKNSKVTLLDFSENALKTAKENALDNKTECNCLLCDILKEIPQGKFDMIVSNPPYIETETVQSLDRTVKDFEPLTALDGGRDGLIFYRRISEISKDILNNNGFIIFEIGYNQGIAVSDILKENGFKNVEVIKDFCDNDRVVKGRKTI